MRRRSALFEHEVASGHKDRSIQDVLAHEVLPHIGLSWNPASNAHKLLTMLYVLRRVARVHYQYEDASFQPEAVDEAMYERLETDGVLMEELFAGTMRQVMMAIVDAVRKDRFSTESDVRRAMAHNDMKRKIQYCIRTGNILNPHKMLMGRRAVTQVAGTFNDTQAASSTRKTRIANQAFGVHLISTAHKPQHVHRLCAVETPEGQMCGSVKHLALFADVSLGLTDAVALRARLCDGGHVDHAITRLQRPEDAAALGPCAGALVLLNGTVIGTCASAPALLATLESWRGVGGVLHPEVGFVRAHKELLDEVRILTDAGRVLCYYAIVDVASQRLRLPRELVPELAAGRLDWKALLRLGYVAPLCAQSAAAARVAFSVRDLRPGVTRYTHCAIHPAGLFGLSAAANIARAHNNNPMRTMFQVSPSAKK